jgi:hypothetical protein
VDSCRQPLSVALLVVVVVAVDFVHSQSDPCRNPMLFPATIAVASTTVAGRVSWLILCRSEHRSRPIKYFNESRLDSSNSR